MTEERPNIFLYWDYRKFLEDYVAYLRARKEFSVREFAKAAGFGSSGYLSMILKRQRNLSPNAVLKLSKGLQLRTSETEFLAQLVLFNQSVDFEKKDKLYKELLRFKKFLTIRKLETASYDFFSHWYASAIFEALANPIVETDIPELANNLQVTEKEVLDSLQVMQQLGLVEHADKIWKRTEVALETPAELNNLVIRNFHRQMMLKGLEKLDELSPKDRELGALTISLSTEKFEEVRRLVHKFQQDINSIFSTDPSPEKIYQLNIQLFPLGSLPAAHLKTRRE